MRIYLKFLMIFSITFALSCGSSGGGSGGSGERVHEKLRVIHAASTLGKITILQDEKPIIENLSYGAATDYLEIDEKAKAIFSIRVDPEFAIPVLAVEEAVVGPYKKTLLVTEIAGKPVFTFIKDQTSSSIPADESRIRFINAASIANSIDVYVTSPGVTLKGRSPVTSTLAFKGASSYFPITSGDYQIRIAVTTGSTTTSTSSAASTATAASSAASSPSSTATAVPDIDYDLHPYAVDSGEEISFILLESRGGGRPYKSITASAPGD